MPYHGDPTRKPYFPNQADLDDLARELELSKGKSELLVSKFKDWNLYSGKLRVTSHRKRHETFSSYFTDEEDITYCHNIPGLFQEIGIEFDSTAWRLFIDSNKTSLKAVLLHNGNEYPSIPLAHSVHLKESYENVKTLLEKLNYDTFKFDVIGDFKIISFLMGLQGGYVKYPCYLCQWDSRADDRHFKQTEWPLRENFTVGQLNVRSAPLVDASKILMPPLHIKLGLMKQFVKALEKGKIPLC